MGEIVMVMGKSGSGKSASLRNFGPGEVGIFNVVGKRLPFRNRLYTADNVNINEIIRRMGKASRDAYVIDDSQYLMTFTLFDRIREKNYDKFTEIGQSFYRLLKAARETPRDCITYFLHHSEDVDGGGVKAKTVGKLLDNHLTLEGLFPIVLRAVVMDGQYYFETQSDGLTTCKSPMGMFSEFRVDNDLRAVDAVIREYWGMKPLGGAAPRGAEPLASASEPYGSGLPRTGRAEASERDVVDLFKEDVDLGLGRYDEETGMVERC